MLAHESMVFMVFLWEVIRRVGTVPWNLNFDGCSNAGQRIVLKMILFSLRVKLVVPDLWFFKLKGTSPGTSANFMANRVQLRSNFSGQEDNNTSSDVEIFIKLSSMCDYVIDFTSTKYDIFLLFYCFQFSFKHQHWLCGLWQWPPFPVESLQVFSWQQQEGYLRQFRACCTWACELAVQTHGMAMLASLFLFLN